MNPEDRQFLEQFEASTLDPTTFSHYAHLRIAWIYISNHDLATACQKTCAGIRRFAASAGDADKFHHTITEFLVRTMAARISAQPTTDFHEFVRDNPDMLEDAKGLMARSYSAESLDSIAAKSGWVEPDLAA